ncbi:hypothetical protein [Endozoicomonas sp. Mp262]|uniref:hypothetical protein n=1 Tax=Endozoicomonas sp. Mp262 TaxID=2919499 RepID=UPI0021DB02DB
MPLIISILKSAVWPIIWAAAKDACLAMIGRIKWATLLERFICRSISNGLRWLAKTNNNGLAGKTAEDALAMLKRDDLPELK